MIFLRKRILKNTHFPKHERTSLIQTAALLIGFKYQNSSKLEDLHSGTFVLWFGDHLAGVLLFRDDVCEIPACRITLHDSPWAGNRSLSPLSVILCLLSLLVNPTPSATGGRSCCAILTGFHQFWDAFTKAQVQWLIRTSKREAERCSEVCVALWFFSHHFLSPLLASRSCQPTGL